MTVPTVTMTTETVDTTEQVVPTTFSSEEKLFVTTTLSSSSIVGTNPVEQRPSSSFFASQPESSTLPTGLIGGVVGGVVFCLILLLTVVLLWRRSRRNRWPASARDGDAGVIMMTQHQSDSKRSNKSKYSSPANDETGLQLVWQTKDESSAGAAPVGAYTTVRPANADYDVVTDAENVYDRVDESDQGSTRFIAIGATTKEKF